MNRKIRVLVADDHELVRAGLKSVIDLEDDMTCVGMAADGVQAVKAAEKSRPDVVVMDLMMPTMGGLEATEQLMQKLPETRVLILTSFGSADELQRALDAGAAGALLKSTPNRELLKAIRRLAAGERVVGAEIAGLISECPVSATLSERQSQILHSVTRGLSNADISAQLGISQGCVKKHLAIIFQKLGTATRAEAAAVALRKHLLKF